MKSININKAKLEAYKMEFFNELIKLVWEEKLEHINNLPEKILGENTYREIDKAIITNLFRITMGLEPIELHDNTLQEMVYEAINADKVNQPIISVVSQVCNYCNKNNNKNETCLVKIKHTDCNKKNTCSACGECIKLCNLGAISDKIQFIPMIKLLKDSNTPVYAIVAPAFVGQFGEDVTAGKLRSAFKKIGFEDMIEVSIAADILTIKEAYDYYEHIKEKEAEYFITSCCCPVWVNLIQKYYPEILQNVSPSVSPMIACGRAIKILNPKAKVVFVGPCIAKKKEATLDDIKDGVDFVLTFTELNEIFSALDINLQHIDEDNRIESSYSGRIYGRAGGVSKAIELSIKRIDKDIKFNSVSFQGAEECKEGLNKVINKEIDATFIEGMGCIGGCVGGPKRIISVEDGTRHINEYGESTNMETPYENINVAQFLTMLGIKRSELLGKEEEKEIIKIFSRDIK